LLQAPRTVYFAQIERSNAFSSSVYRDRLVFSDQGAMTRYYLEGLITKFTEEDLTQQVASALQSLTATAFAGMQIPVKGLPCRQDWRIGQTDPDSFRFRPSEGLCQLSRLR
jgi:hypothetical protein